MEKVSFYANVQKAGVAEALASLRAGASALGLAVCADGEPSDAVVALGGDGTFLRAVHESPACLSSGSTSAGSATWRASARAASRTRLNSVRTLADIRAALSGGIML